MRCVAEAQLRNAARCYSGSCGPAARGLVTKGCCAAQHPQHEGIIVIGRSRAAGCARSFRSAGVACDWLVECCGLCSPDSRVSGFAGRHGVASPWLPGYLMVKVWVVTGFRKARKVCHERSRLSAHGISLVGRTPLCSRGFCRVPCPHFEGISHGSSPTEVLPTIRGVAAHS